MTDANLAAHRANGRRTQGPVTPAGKANSAAANLRHGFYSQAREQVLEALGEDPEDYLHLMDSLLEDLQPREGLENQLVVQMGETLWRMRRAQRMQEGLALKRIQSRVLGEQTLATARAAQAMEKVEPFELLEKALARRAGGPTAEEIQAFMKSCKGDSSEEIKEFIVLLKSLEEPMDERARKAARRKARAELNRLMDSRQSAAIYLASEMNKVQAPENLAALMAPAEVNSMFLQRMEDSNLRRLWRLTNTLMKVRQGGLRQKDVKNAGRSGDMYENKGSGDTMTETKIDFVSENARDLQNSAAS